jgi:hypothetical protein
LITCASNETTLMIFERGHFKGTKTQKGFIAKSLNESRNFTASTAHPDKITVFLSHRHKDLEDEEELIGFIEMLEELGAKVYIDSIDNALPDQTCGETAKRIKEIIKYCNKFILFGTTKAIESYWCNWELGVSDTHKFDRHIAILPIKEKSELDSFYKGNEYLQIYPRINYEDGTQANLPAGYYVSEPSDRNGIKNMIPLSEWLKQ